MRRLLFWPFLAATLTAGLLAAGAAGAQEAGADRAALIERALAAHILPAYERLADATGALAETAESCDAGALRGAYHAAFDAWMGASHIALGPIEEDGRRFLIQFWPDTKGHTRKAVARLIRSKSAVVDDPAAFEKVSVAAHGLMALERLLFDDDGPIGFDGEDGAYRCRLAAAVARGLDAAARETLAGWGGPDGYAALLRDAGSEDNPLYFTPDDAARDLFKSLDGGLQAIVDLRLGRPLGSFDRPRPRRAEAWRSGRPLRNIRLSLAALRAYYQDVFAETLSEEERGVVASVFDRTELIAERTPEPLIEAVAEPGSRLAVEALQSQARTLQERLRKSVAPAVGASIGFNSLDGD